MGTIGFGCGGLVGQVERLAVLLDVTPVVEFERVDARFGHAFELNEDMFAQRFEGWPAPVRCLRFEGFERLDREIQTIVRTIFSQEPMARELRDRKSTV